MKFLRRILTLSLIFACNSNLFGQDYGLLHLTKLNSTLYKITRRNDPRSNNMLVSFGKDGLLLVDTGNKSDSEDFKKMLRDIVGGTAVPKIIINTHLHMDHTGANDAFDNDPLIMAHANVRRDFDEGRYMYIGLSERSKPDIAISEPTSFYFNGEEIKIIPIPGSHSDGDMYVHFTKSKVVAMGDVGYGMGYPTWDSLNGNASLWSDVINDVLNKTEGNINYISGHGRDVNREEMKEFEKMLRATAKIVKDEMDKGKDLETIQKDNDFAAWKSFEGGFGTRAGYILSLFNSYKYPERTKSLLPTLYRIYEKSGIDKTIETAQEINKTVKNRRVSSRNIVVFAGKIADEKKYDDAISLLKIVETDYSDSYPQWATYLDIGNVYLRMENYVEAKKYYEKSLASEENKIARDKLEQLKKK